MQLYRALSRVNLLGMIALEPKDLLPADIELPLPNPVIAANELLDTARSPLVAISRLESVHASTMANRILHPPISGDVVEALLSTDALTRASHAVDDVCAELLAEGRVGEALAQRGRVLAAAITQMVDERAEWGAHDRPTAAELLGPLSA